MSYFMIFYECLENSEKVDWYHDNKIWGQFSVDVLHCHLAPICNILSGKVGKTSPHYDCFLQLLSKNYLRQTSILGTNKSENQKNKDSYFTSTLEVDIKNVLLFFSDFLLIGI